MIVVPWMQPVGFRRDHRNHAQMEQIVRIKIEACSIDSTFPARRPAEIPYPTNVTTLSGVTWHTESGMPQKPMSRTMETRREKLDLRLTPSAKRALQVAARAAQRSVSEFVLESALARADETLPGSSPLWPQSGTVGSVPGGIVGPAPVGAPAREASERTQHLRSRPNLGDTPSYRDASAYSRC